MNANTLNFLYYSFLSKLILAAVLFFMSVCSVLTLTIVSLTVHNFSDATVKIKITLPYLI